MIKELGFMISLNRRLNNFLIRQKLNYQITMLNPIYLFQLITSTEKNQSQLIGSIYYIFMSIKTKIITINFSENSSMVHLKLEVYLHLVLEPSAITILV